MSALAAVVRKEWRELRRMRSLWLAGALLWSAVFVGGVLDYRQLASDRIERAAAVLHEREHLSGRGAMDIHKSAHLGLHVFKTLPGLAALDRGVDPYTGQAVWLEPHRPNDPLLRPAESAPEVRRFGSLSAALMLQLVAPLFLILLAHDAFTRERTRGTAAYGAAFGLTRRDFVLGKLLALGALALLLTGPPTLAVSLMLGLYGESVGLAALILLLVYAGYYILWLALSLAASLRLSSAAAVLALLLPLWFVNAFFLPRMAAEAAAVLAPLPGAAGVRNAMLDEVLKLDTAPQVEVRLAELRAEYGVTRDEDLPFPVDGIEYLVKEEMANAIIDRYQAPVYQALETQTHALQWAAWASPHLALTQLSQALTGTDALADLAFVRGAEAFRRQMLLILNGGMLRENPDGYRRGDVRLWSMIPVFETPRREASAVATSYAPAVLALLVWIAAALCLLRWAQGRAPLEASR